MQETTEGASPTEGSVPVNRQNGGTCPVPPPPPRRADPTYVAHTQVRFNLLLFHTHKCLLKKSFLLVCRGNKTNHLKKECVIGIIKNSKGRLVICILIKECENVPEISNPIELSQEILNVLKISLGLCYAERNQDGICMGKH